MKVDTAGGHAGREPQVKDESAAIHLVKESSLTSMSLIAGPDW